MAPHDSKCNIDNSQLAAQRLAFMHAITKAMPVCMDINYIDYETQNDIIANIMQYNNNSSKFNVRTRNSSAHTFSFWSVYTL